MPWMLTYEVRSWGVYSEVMVVSVGIWVVRERFGVDGPTSDLVGLVNLKVEKDGAWCNTYVTCAP